MSSYYIGSAALTTRGFKEKDFVQVAEFLHRYIFLLPFSFMNELAPFLSALELVIAVNKAAAGPKLVDYEAALNSADFASAIQVCQQRTIFLA